MCPKILNCLYRDVMNCLGVKISLAKMLTLDCGLNCVGI